MRYWVHVDTFDDGDMKVKAMKPLEEASEAREATQRYEAGGDDAERDKAVYECCDVLTATLNLLVALGVTQAELDATVAEVHDNNEARGRYR